MRWRYHVACGTRVMGVSGFAFGRLASDLASSQPGFELCIPAFRVCCVSVSDVRSPRDAVSEHCYRDFLYMDSIRFLSYSFLPTVC